MSMAGYTTRASLVGECFCRFTTQCLHLSRHIATSCDKSLRNFTVVSHFVLKYAPPNIATTLATTTAMLLYKYVRVVVVFWWIMLYVSRVLPQFDLLSIMRRIALNRTG